MFGLVNRLLRGTVSRRHIGVPGTLSGRCKLTGNLISGWIDNSPIIAELNTQVQAVRSGAIISVCDVGSDDGSQRLPFALPMEGCFSISEVALGLVTLIARNEYGDTGTLHLDGAMQLEAIREHFGLPVATVLDLDFSQTGNARAYLRGGWYEAESERTWTSGKDSIVQFDRPSEPGEYLLRMRTDAFIAPLVPVQPMDISVGDQLIGAFQQDISTMQFRELRLPASLVIGEGICQIKLHHPWAACPNDHLGNSDLRHIAFGFRRMSVVRLLESEYQY